MLNPIAFFQSTNDRPFFCPHKPTNTLILQLFLTIGNIKNSVASNMGINRGLRFRHFTTRSLQIGTRAFGDYCGARNKMINCFPN